MSGGAINRLFDLSGRVVIATGTGGLLETEYAAVLAEAGANIVAADIRQQVCQEVQEAIMNSKYK